MRDLLDEYNWPRFSEVVESHDPAIRVYVYRLNGALKLKPALYKGRPFPDILEWLRDEHGSGDYALLARRGETMILSGALYIEAPRNWRRR